MAIALAAVAWWSSAASAQAPKPGPGEKTAPKAPDAPEPDAPDKPEPAPTPETKPGEKPPAPKPGEKAGPAKPDVTQPEPPDVEEPKPGPKTQPKAAAPAEKPRPIIEMTADDSLRNAKIAVLGILKGGTLTPAQVTQVTDYYTKFALPRWTKVAERAEVRKFRRELQNELREAAGQGHDLLISILLEWLPKIVEGEKEGDYQPVARVNAMLAIGELNSVEPKAAGAPVPLAEAQPILVAAALKKELPDAVRVAALVGITRHAELEAVTGEELNKAAAALVALATSAPEPGRSPAGHAWMRTMAIDALAELKSPGPTGQVASALTDIMGEPNAPLSVRSAGARALGSLAYPGGFQTDVAKIVRQMGQAAFDAIGEEVQRYQKLKGEFGRRRVQTHLIGVYNGLTGMASLASQPADAALHAKVLEAVRGSLQALENDKLTDSQLAAELTKQAAQLTQALAAPAAPAAAAAAAPAVKP